VQSHPKPPPKLEAFFAHLIYPEARVPTSRLLSIERAAVLRYLLVESMDAGSCGKVGPMLHVRNIRAMIFDQAPKVLSAAERAAHWHVASPEYHEIARLCG